MNLAYITSAESWAALFPDGTHFLQSYAWGQLKSSVGNKVYYITLNDNNDSPTLAAVLLVKKVGPFRVGYVPRGPVSCGNSSATAKQAFGFLEHIAKDRRLHLLNIDPDAFLNTEYGDEWHSLLQANKHTSAARQVQSRGTGVSDLSQIPENLDKMDKSTRYNIRKSTKDGITFDVRPASKDLMDTFYELYVGTGGRKGFGVYSKKYYKTLVAEMNSDPLVKPYFGIASHPDIKKPMSMAFLLVSGKRAYYFYAASTLAMRNSMPNYGLQWHCLNWAKATGAATYDWWGAPFDPKNKKDSMAGVWHFKKSFLPAHRQLVGNHTYRSSGPAPLLALYLLKARDTSIIAKRKVKHLLRR